VPAVSEAAAAGERRDLTEDRVDPVLIEELQLAHPRGVEQQAAAREEHELAMGRDVAAPTRARAR